jgi:hypothetical protein
MLPAVSFRYSTEDSCLNSHVAKGNNEIKLFLGEGWILRRTAFNILLTTKRLTQVIHERIPRKSMGSVENVPRGRVGEIATTSL